MNWAPMRMSNGMPRLFARPAIDAMPGMPPGSPGMEVGNRKDPYDVFLIDRSGRETVFAHYPKL